MNRVILVGNLTRDPELRTTNGGTQVADLGLAVNERRRNSNGDLIDDTLFTDITVWGVTAENCSKFLGKGSSILVEGKLKLDTWTTEQGEKRSKLRVNADRVEFLRTKEKKLAATEGEPAAVGATQNADVPF